MVLFELIRFSAVGVMNTLLDFSIYNALAGRLVGVGRVLASAVSVSVGMVFSFLANRHWVFGAEGGGWDQAVLFLAVTLTSAYGIQSMVIATASYGSREIVHFGYWVAEATPKAGVLTSEQVHRNGVKVLAVGAGAVWNFLWYKFVVFGPA